MMLVRSAAALLAVLVAPVAVSSPPPTDYAALVIGAPPTELQLDRFYRRYVDAAGIPVVASGKVPDAALLLARDIAVAMLENRPDLRRQLVADKARIAIMAPDEGTTDLPEQRNWTKPARDDPRLTECERKNYDSLIGRLSDREYWNTRARGMGGLLSSGATENLLEVPGTRYFGENIFVHEFSHTIMVAIEQADPALFGRIQRAYADARRRGLWSGEYGSTNAEEYWAEGTQFWFNSNKVSMLPTATILSDQDLARYDPALYNVLEEVFGAGNHHLAGDLFYNHPARSDALQQHGKLTRQVC